MSHNSKYRKRAPISSRSFRRRNPVSNLSGSAILIATEGEVTEPIYFESLTREVAAQTIKIITLPVGIGHPRSLVDKTLEHCSNVRKRSRKNKTSIIELEKFDHIWVVFDTDVLNAPQLREGIQYAESKGIKTATSTPCFEYWLLLHQTYTTSPMNDCRETVPKLLEAFGWQKYSKSRDIQNGLIPPLATKTNISQAVRYSTKVRDYHNDASTKFPNNPFTTVDLLIENINDAIGPANKFL